MGNVKYTEGATRQRGAKTRGCTRGVEGRFRAPGGVQGWSTGGIPGGKAREALVILHIESAEISSCYSVKETLHHFIFCKILC